MRLSTRKKRCLLHKRYSIFLSYSDLNYFSLREEEVKNLSIFRLSGGVIFHISFDKILKSPQI